MNKCILLFGTLASAAMAAAMGHIGWRDSAQALLSCAFVLSWLWAAHNTPRRDTAETIRDERDHLRHLLTRVAYKLKDLPPNIEPLGWSLHEELWTAVSKPPNDGAVRIDGPPRDGDTHEPVVGLRSEPAK